ncbi:hypothetical protein [Spirosoma montaniterrae]|uniref:Outer membrane protein beta-barrel domain-containing protein n=1 Tax=Spirosoma montaniterrae TaxID=1178516 RepID=A0A1P9X1M4_9BACT|nr:hypothetical protein [Spirosoma montaniterrae]AQG81520.1 hypothetical protein AWR27_20700 [Spirosoma montaniterrae]
MKPTLLFFLLCSCAVNAQTTDSTRIEHTTEDPAVSASEFKRLVRYITRADVEEKTLIKLGFWPSTDRRPTYENRTFGIGLNLDVSIEQKITPALSFVAGVTGLARYETYRITKLINPVPGIPPTSTYYDRLEWGRDIELSARLGFRYYYNLLARMRKGLSANNFSANYIAAQVSEPFLQFGDGEVYNRLTEDRRRYSFRDNLLGDPQPRILVGYGIQRRLGRSGFFDINAGPEIIFTGGSGTRTSLQINALIGLGW